MSWASCSPPPPPTGTVQPVSEDAVRGVERGLGLQTVLSSRVSTDHPFSFAETPEGLLLLANGIDPVLVWDGQNNRVRPAGVIPPPSPVLLGGVGPGPLVGKFVAFQRYLDIQGNPSDLSPISNLVDTGADGLVQDVTYDRTTGVVTVHAPQHGLAGTQAVRLVQIGGFPSLNSNFNVQVTDPDHFQLLGIVLTYGIYEGGGSWMTGVSSFIYSQVQAPSDDSAVRRQILRNLAGTLESLYVDIDTTDLVSTSFVSSRTDADLIGSQEVPLFYGTDDLPYANRNARPPNHKTVLCTHKGRIYAGVDAVYSVGHAEPAFDSVWVQGVGTDWRQTFIGRQIAMAAASRAYTIVDVDETNQKIKLSEPYHDPIVKFTFYSIRPAPSERRLIYFSEASRPESWPAYNAVAIPETNDEITGLFSFGQYLYVFERLGLHRITFQGNPSEGAVFFEAERGSINNRTYVMVESTMYIMDEVGIYKFDGQDAVSISLPIQNMFQDDGTSSLLIDWDADQTLWHAAHDPARDTIRWFVAFRNEPGLKSAIAYNYRTDRFWVETYPQSITASTYSTIGSRRSLVGTEARRILCLGQGFWEGLNGTGSLRGTVTAATPITLTDSFADFRASESAPVTIVDGTGAGQVRTVATVTATTIEVLQPWDFVPDATSIYQIGGASWTFRTGWFRFFTHEEDLPRDVELVFLPTHSKTLVMVRLFFDHATVPRPWARSLEADNVQTLDNDPVIRISLNAFRGWARQRMRSHSGSYAFGDTFISAELSGVQAGEAILINQLVLNDIES